MDKDLLQGSVAGLPYDIALKGGKIVFKVAGDPGIVDVAVEIGVDIVEALEKAKVGAAPMVAMVIDLIIASLKA